MGVRQRRAPVEQFAGAVVEPTATAKRTTQVREPRPLIECARAVGDPVAALPVHYRARPSLPSDEVCRRSRLVPQASARQMLYLRVELRHIATAP